MSIPSWAGRGGDQQILLKMMQQLYEDSLSSRLKNQHSDQNQGYFLSSILNTEHIRLLCSHHYTRHFILYTNTYHLPYVMILNILHTCTLNKIIMKNQGDRACGMHGGKEESI
jgi:hypothetical protein